MIKFLSGKNYFILACVAATNAQHSLFENEISLSEVITLAVVVSDVTAVNVSYSDSDQKFAGNLSSTSSLEVWAPYPLILYKTK
jgi:hypothetical protein